MEQITEGAVDKREEIKNKLRQCFDGKIVRKDLTKKIKEGANVPVYVLEFLLGQYCSSDDDEIIAKGVENVKRILADNFVRPERTYFWMMSIRRNMTGCFAAVYGASCSWTMNMWKRKRRTACRYRSGS